MDGSEIMEDPEVLAAIIDASEDAIYVVALDGTVVLWNKSAERLYGYTADEIVGQSLTIIAAPGTEDEMSRMIEQIRRGETIHQRETTRKHKEGSIFPVSLTISPIKGTDGNVAGAALYGCDATQAKMRERFRLVVEAAPNGMVLVDDQGLIVFVNSQIENMFGYQRQELIGQPVEILVPPRFRANHPGLRRSFMAAPVARPMGAGRDLFALKKDGTEMPVEIGLNPMSTDSRTYVLASIIDISERKRAEELIKARDEALALSKLKSAFIANISHELRTPLSGILGMNELLLQMNLGAEQKEAAEAIREAAQSLLSIVNDILDIARIEAGKLTLNSVPMNVFELVQQAVRVLSELARKKKLRLIATLDNAIPEYVLGDLDRIRQVLLNLIGNAVKFTDSGQVTVSATVEREEQEFVEMRFAVSDTGIGIEESQINTLFEPFRQLDSSPTRRYGGTGLGLSICKTLVEMMGGTIGAESVIGQGSTFWFTIPLRQLEREHPLPESGRAEPSRRSSTEDGAPVDGHLVLIAEDNALLQTLALKQLRKLGLEAHLVTTGYQAVSAATEIAFDLILMDISMPELDGLEATRRIREFEKTIGRHTPIIAMTAAAMKSDLQRCRDAGMDDYLAKPVAIEELKAKLQNWLLVKRIHET